MEIGKSSPWLDVQIVANILIGSLEVNLIGRKSAKRTTDQIAENTLFQNASKNVDEIVTPMLRRGLPWAGTYGNHDSDFNLSRADIYHREKRWNNSLTRWDVHGRNAGVSNYYLLVHSADESKTLPELILWFFDSRGGNYKGQIDPVTGNRVPQPGWVDESVVRWFNNTKKMMQKEYKQTIPSLAVSHIVESGNICLTIRSSSTFLWVLAQRTRLTEMAGTM